MGRDRYERKHRRTMQHPESVRMMADANMDVVEPLEEAMSNHPSECPVCGKFYMLVHYDGVPTWIHPGKCVPPGDVDDGDYIAERVAERDDAPPNPMEE